MTGHRIINSDCREAMAAMDADSVDSIVTDPPYGLSFMGKGWDHGVPGIEFWQAALRVIKPGGHLLAFGGTRTFHRLMVAIEDAGWELRDTIGWIYGSGFPKSLDVSKAIDKAAGAEREVVGSKAVTRILDPEDVKLHNYAVGLEGRGGEIPVTAPATDAAKQWEGWGTALKPAWEPIVVARKPLIGTVAENVLRHGTGGINVDGCRVAGNIDEMRGRSGTSATPGGDTTSYRAHNANGGVWDPSDLGRWPANIITDGSEEVTALFPVTTSGDGTVKRASSKSRAGNQGAAYGAESRPDGTPMIAYGDTGSAARFFYQAKASKADRNEGLTEGTVNNHPTVKPTALMRYLCRLVTPPGGRVLDPFCGSGSTGKAAVLEGFRFVGVEQDPAYVEIARARISAAVDVDAPAAAGRRQIGLFGGAA